MAEKKGGRTERKMGLMAQVLIIIVVLITICTFTYKYGYLRGHNAGIEKVKEKCTQDVKIAKEKAREECRLDIKMAKVEAQEECNQDIELAKAVVKEECNQDIEIVKAEAQEECRHDIQKAKSEGINLGKKNIPAKLKWVNIGMEPAKIKFNDCISIRPNECNCDENNIGKRIFIYNSSAPSGSYVVELEENIGFSALLSPDSSLITFKGGKNCSGIETTERVNVLVYECKAVKNNSI